MILKLKIYGTIAQIYSDQAGKHYIGSIMFDKHIASNDNYPSQPCDHHFYLNGQEVADIHGLSIA